MGKDRGSSLGRFVSILCVGYERRQAEHDECSELQQQKWAIDWQRVNLAEQLQFKA